MKLLEAEQEHSPTSTYWERFQLQRYGNKLISADVDETEIEDTWMETQAELFLVSESE